jgi:hypothetical protein
MSSNAITDQNQGGGDKKAGFPFMIGRDSWTSIYMDNTNVVNGNCCKLSNYNTVLFPLANFSRNINSLSTGNYGYWKIPNTR